MKFTLSIPPRITRDLLLQRNTQETYLSYYLGVPIKRGVFRSPLRKDTYPTCSFYRGKSGDLLFHDFGTGEFLDFIQVVMKKYTVSYFEALKIIANDFGIRDYRGLSRCTKAIVQVEEYKDTFQCVIQAEIQEFTPEELEWWNKYGISRETLKKFNVFSVKTVFLNGEIYSVSSPRSPTFGYYKGKSKDGIELWKIYFPYRKKMRFLTNCNKDMIQCAQQLPRGGDFLVITKSTKDCLVFHEMGIPAIAPQSESSFLNEKQYRNVMKRFKHILVLYDNDLPGIRSMQKFRRQFRQLGLELKCAWIPRNTGCKDISDYYKRYGREKTSELINTTKEWLAPEREQEQEVMDTN